MSRSHPSTNPSTDPNDPFARLLGADERRVPRAEFRAALRQHMLTFAPTPGLPIDAPLLGRVVVRPVHVLVAALLGVTAIAGVTAQRLAYRAGLTAPPLSAQPAAPPSDPTTAQRPGDAEPIRSAPASAPVAAPAFARPLPVGAVRRATVAARSVADRPERGPMTRSSDAEPGDAVTLPVPLRPAVAADAGPGAADRTVPAAPVEASGVPEPAAPPAAPPADRDRDRDRPAAAPSATATATASDPAGGIGSISPPLLPPEPVAPTPAPAAAMPTVPVAPSPTAPTPGP